MSNRNGKAYLITFVIMGVFLYSTLNSTFSNAQATFAPKTVNTTFNLEEMADFSNTEENITSITVPIPDSSWNVTRAQLNFTDIKLERETVTIEDQIWGDYERIYYRNTVFKRYGLGVQINLTVSTILYGAYVYGYKTSDTTEMIKIQIRGFDAINHKPNSTIYASKDLNLDIIPDWYAQNFDAPVSLSPGNYYLVLNGTNISSDTTSYYWAYNNVDPQDPSLYTSECITVSNWVTGIQNSPFLYKLVQKVDKKFDPEDIEMKVSINGVDYPISNSIIPGSGNLVVEYLNFSPNSTILSLPILNNITSVLNYSLSYEFSIYNVLTSHASVLIVEDEPNTWNVNPPIYRPSSNYTVRFNYPHNWYNLQVFRNSENVTSLIMSIPGSITIPNNTINDGVEWLISAASPNLNIDLHVPTSKFEVGQELIFSLSTPARIGHYYFDLYNPLGYDIFSANLTLPGDSTTFSYTIPENAYEGNFKAYVYWFNGTDAGLAIHVFEINVPFTIDPVLLLVIAISSGIIITGSVSTYKVVRRNSRRKAARREDIRNKFFDILNLNYVMITEKRTSLNVYEQSFTKANIDPTLISGFLSAIRSFGLELTNVEDEAQTIKLEYHNSKILMSDFKDFRIILIMKENPSHKFFDSIKKLSHDIDQKYGKELETFKGDLRPFQDLELVLNNDLGTALLYPLRVVNIKNVKLNPIEKSLMNKAIDMQSNLNLDHFYITRILEENGDDPKVLASLFNLVDKKIFQPVI